MTRDRRSFGRFVYVTTMYRAGARCDVNAYEMRGCGASSTPSTVSSGECAAASSTDRIAAGDLDSNSGRSPSTRTGLVAAGSVGQIEADTYWAFGPSTSGPIRRVNVPRSA